MFGRKSARIAELENENDDLVKRNKALLREVAQTGLLLTSARDGRDMALRQNAHLTAERDSLAKQLQPFLDRRARDKATLAEHNERRHLEALQRAAVRDGTAGIQNAQPKANAAAVQGASTAV
jgi:hypothetical protein